MSLELFIKPGIVQPNVFPEVGIKQELPVELLMHGVFVLDLLQGVDLPNQTNRFEEIQSLTVEY